MNTCETCAFWTAWSENKGKLSGHHCLNPKLISNGKNSADEYKMNCGNDELFFPYDEGIDHFETGKDFGCIHHQQK